MDHWIAVDVEAIVSRKIWNAAQARFAINKRDSLGNTTHKYLFRKRCACGKCGYKISAHASRRRTAYYRCPGVAKPECFWRGCNLPPFRVDQVDTAVWDWVEEVFTDEEKLEQAFEAYQAEMETETNPLKERLSTIDGLIAKHQEEWADKMESLNIVKSKLAKATLANDLERIETGLTHLRQQREELIGKLSAKSLTENQRLTLRGFAVRMRADLELFRRDFESRRLLIEETDMRIVLLTIDGQKYVDVEAKIGRKRVPIVSNSINLKKGA